MPGAACDLVVPACLHGPAPPCGTEQQATCQGRRAGEVPGIAGNRPGSPRPAAAPAPPPGGICPAASSPPFARGLRGSATAA
ncbi:hypothetical protein RC1_2936 [Rhodospirillum centenum SW]|uniref:Uncharacterized protein n=1 Tax=Rhodospirillum centenum (strain ATCC 51521 / SW) TaxID=414684 RepID=B6IVI0_RHOCS|nr:hypothetical protein RC1_2936 [Rhodospirillum centenum SW]